MQLKRSEILLVLVPVLLALVAGYLQAITWSDRIGWDTVSYLDVAEAFRNGRMDLALSPYWSPLYPLLYAATSLVFASTPERISLSIFQYFCFLLFGLASFYFWKTVLKAHQQLCEQDGTTPLPALPLCFFATSVSIYSGLVVGDLAVKSPDMLAAGLFLFANGLILSGIYKTAAVGRLVLTGFLMGLTYLAKSFFISWMLPCLALLFWQRKTYNLGGQRFLILAITALLTVACYAVPLSIRTGYPTIGEAGKYQFVFAETEQIPPLLPLVHGTRVRENLLTQQPRHPSRVFFEDPKVYEFAEPFDVAYPPWFNPHYWNEGFKVNFDWKSFARMLPEKIVIVVAYISVLSLFMMVWLGLINKSLMPFSISRIKILSPIVLPSKLCVLLLIALVIWPRYLIGLVPPLFAGVILLCRYPDGPQGAARCGKMLWTTSFIMLTAFFLTSLFHIYFAFPQLETLLSKSTGAKFPVRQIDPHSATAAKLKQLGIKSRDRVARIALFEKGEYYWARLANVRVVCESVGAPGFFKTPLENREELYRKLGDFGVKAIVLDWSNRVPVQGPVPNEDGWVPVPGTSNYVKVLTRDSHER